MTKLSDMSYARLIPFISALLFSLLAGYRSEGEPVVFGLLAITWALIYVGELPNAVKAAPVPTEVPRG